MQPTTSDVHIDAALTQVSIAYKNDVLIAEKIFPVINVKKDSDKYFVYGKQSLKSYSLDRAPGTRAKQVEWNIDSTPTYSVVERAAEVQLIDEVRENADDPIKYDADSTEFGTDVLKLDLERRIANIVQTAGNYAPKYSGVPATKWNDPGADILADLDTAREKVRKAILKLPNTLVLSQDVYLTVRRHPKLLEYYKYTRGGTLSVDILKEVFEVENLLVGVSSYDAAQEGKTQSMTDIWTNTAALLYVPKTPGLKQISFGYIFRKSGYPLVERWREDAVRSDWLRVSDKYDCKIIDSYAGYLFKSVLS
jgi:3'-phosphoadenosine 5'-phosphosulfate sulfotransferase